MENQLTIFKNPAFGEVRVIKDENDSPWFVGKDIAEVLGYAKPRNAIANHVDEDDKKDAPIQGPLGGTQTMTLINESGMYSLILSSKLPTAKQFKHWVTSEVLPAIRKDGGYIAVRHDETPEELYCRVLKMADARLKEIEKEKALLAEKAEHLDKVILCNQCYTTTQIAKELNMSVHELTDILIQKHIIYRQSGQNMLYAEYARLGLAKNRTAEKIMEDGSIKVFHPYMVWTERGRVFLHNLVKENPTRINHASALLLIQPSLFS